MLTNRINLKSVAVLALLAGSELASIQPTTSAAADYFVSPSGNNSNPGTQELPFLTIQQGANVAQAGDNVYMLAGTYQENVIVDHGGSDYDHMLSFLAYGNGEVVVDAVIGYGMLVEMGADYVKVDGLTFINGHLGPQNGAGLRTMGNYGIYTHNTFHDNRHGIFISCGLDSSGREFVNSQLNEVAYNISYNNEVSGIWIKRADSTRVHHNLCYGIGTLTTTRGAITFYSGSGNQIYNNTIYDNFGYGIDIYNGTSPAPTPDSRVYNNLVAVANSSNIVFDVDLLPSQDSTNQYHHNLWYDSDAAPLFAWGYDQFFQGGQMLSFAQYVQTAQALNPMNGVGDFVAEPLLANPLQGDYSLRWESPAIDAGPTDPATYDPDGTRADLGAFFFDQSGSGEIAVTATPVNPPIIIPAIGGSFAFDVSLTNVGSTPRSFDGWTDVTLPVGGHYGPLLPPRLITLNSGASLIRRLTQSVPATAPPGEYTLNVYAGDYSPILFLGTDRFTFQKLGVASSLPDEPNWAVSGSLEIPDAESPPTQPVGPLLYGALPNPFNPSTLLRFELPVASNVTLDVYDISGRLVSVLASGWMEAGRHTAVFDGAQLPSGVYVYRLRTGNSAASGKMLLMK